MANAITTKVDAARKKIIDKVPLNKYLLDKKYLYTDELEGKICCPVHEEHSPSFFFDTEKGVYHCFGCGSKGSVVELETAIEKKENERANAVKSILKLSRVYHVDIPDMFEYGDLSKPRRKRRNKFDFKQDLKNNETTVYNRKLERLEEQAKVLNPIDRIRIYKVVDEVYLENMTPKEAYKKVDSFLETKRNEGVV